MWQGLLQKVFLNNRVIDYLICCITIILGIIALNIIRRYVITRLRSFALRTATKFDDYLINIIERVVLPLLYFGVFYLGVRTLNLNPTIGKVIDVLGLVLLTYLGIRILGSTFEYLTLQHWLKHEPDSERVMKFRAILPAIKVIFWGLGLVFLLDNLGFKITTVIAGLGIGGVAVALAAQAILGDLFSYFAILFDRPFEVGDFIIIEDLSGTVEYIGLKTTRIRSINGEQVVIANKDLTNSRIRNYKRMERRRVVFRIGVIYETSLEQLKEIPNIIKNIISQIPEATFDRAHFFSYGDFSLVFEIVYFVNDRNYYKYMNIQQEINLRIKEEFERRQIKFAYPTKTVYFSKLADT